MSPEISESPTGDIEVEIIDSNHAKKPSQEDHSGGGHGGHDDHEEEVGLGDVQTWKKKPTEKYILFPSFFPFNFHACMCTCWEKGSVAV